MSSSIGKESIERVRLWQRKTIHPGEPHRRASRFANTIGSALIDQLASDHTPQEIMGIIEKTTNVFVKSFNAESGGLGERDEGFLINDTQIDKEWLMRALISPELAAKYNLFEKLYGMLVEENKDWIPGLKNASSAETVALIQKKYDTDWFPKK